MNNSRLLAGGVEFESISDAAGLWNMYNTLLLRTDQYAGPGTPRWTVSCVLD